MSDTRTKNGGPVPRYGPTTRSVFAASQQAAVITDAAGYVIWSNPALTTLTGYQPDELRGERPFVFYMPGENDDLYGEMWHAVQAGEAWHGHVNGRRKDGTPYLAFHEVWPIKDQAGEIAQILAILKDVTAETVAVERLTRHAEQQQELAELGRLALTDVNPKNLTKLAVSAIARALRPDLVAAHYQLDKASRPELLAISGYHNLGSNPNDILRPLTEQVAFALAHNATIIRNVTRPATSSATLLQGTSVSSISVPFGNGTEAYGAITVNAVDRYEDTAFLESVTNLLGIAIQRAERDNDAVEAAHLIISANDAAIEGWAAALDLRDHETDGHSRRVTELATALGRKMNLTQHELRSLRRGTLMHDIGKIGIPDSILHKPGPLTPEERQIMETHPTLGCEFLARIPFMKNSLDIPRSHHERWDGGGYPDHLKGEEIPLNARIFAIVDVYDALTNDRPYRDAWSNAEALDHIEKEAGRHFDPAVTEVFLTLMREREEETPEISRSETKVEASLEGQLEHEDVPLGVVPHDGSNAG